jgi:1,4-dihydroxy-2-naphthoyl-CoA hydrolase
MGMDADQDHRELLNGLRRGFDEAMGFTYVKATLDEVRAELEVGPVHLQQYGLVHGGVHAGLIEVLCSAGAAMNAMARGQGGAVGLENSTSFLRAVRSGKLQGVARPIVRGHRTQVWEAEVRDGLGRLVAKGRVRLLCLEKGEEAGGAGSP